MEIYGLTDRGVVREANEDSIGISRTKNGITIYLPENNPSVAVNKIKTLNQTHKLLSRDISVIDMRDNARILVKTRK